MPANLFYLLLLTFAALTPGERTLRARVAAHESWAATEDRSARTAPARAVLWQRFLDQADGDPVRAESLRKAYYARLSFASAKARRQRVQARLAAKPAGGEPLDAA